MADPDQPIIVSDLLAFLKHAYATEQTERVLDDRTHRLAYDAWAAVKDSILEAWMWATDPRNLQPEVPKVMRDARNSCAPSRQQIWIKRQWTASITP